MIDKNELLKCNNVSPASYLRYHTFEGRLGLDNFGGAEVCIDRILDGMIERAEQGDFTYHQRLDPELTFYAVKFIRSFLMVRGFDAEVVTVKGETVINVGWHRLP